MKLILFSLIILFAGCKQIKEKSSDTKVMKKEFSPIRNKEYSQGNCILISSLTKSFQDSIIRHYRLQKYAIIEEDNNQQYQLTEADIEIGSKIIYESLVKNGFKPIDHIEYKKKITDFFKIQPGVGETNSYIIRKTNYFINLSNPFNESLEVLLGTSNDSLYQHIFFITNYNIISYVPLIRNFIQNPNYEDKITDVTKICIPEVLIHRNKFLFNDNNGSLTWLINNDIDFLERLVREFGYDKNNKINKAVLSKISREYNNIDIRENNERLLINLFAKKNNNGYLDIRENLCKYIYNGDNTSVNYQFVRMMYDLATLMISKTYIVPDLNEDEKLKVATYLGYYIELYYNKYYKDIDLNKIEGAYTGSFFRNNLASTGDNNLLESIKRNYYYNLPGLENMIVNVLEQTEEESEEWLRSHPDSFNQ